jgi:hypothetical protein
MKHTGADSRLALTQRLKLRQLLLLGMLTPNVAANDLYAAPTEERFHAVVNLSLILRWQAWDEKVTRRTEQRVQYGAHDGACSVCDLDDEGLLRIRSGDQSAECLNYGPAFRPVRVEKC